MGRRSAEDGISEVVGFVIILAVVMAGLSLYLTYAVPVQGREEEIKVMDGVRAWFVDYKTGDGPALARTARSMPESAIGIDDGQALFNATIGQVTLRKVINAGTVREKGFVERYMPVLAPIPSSAEVSVRNDGALHDHGIERNGRRVLSHLVRSPPPPSGTPRTTTTGSSRSTTTSSAASSSGSGTEGRARDRERDA